MSRGELAFFRVLRAAAPFGLCVQAKVRLADVLSCSEWAWRHGHGGRISQKHLDFVLCDAGSMKFVLAIELDDRSHERPERKERDRFLNSALRAAGMPLLRVRAASRYSRDELRAAIEDRIQQGGGTSPPNFDAPATALFSSGKSA